MNPVPGIDDRRALLLRQKDLLGVFHGNRLAIHSNLERTEGACLQSGFKVGEFHRGKSKPGRSEGKPQPVRRIEKTDRLKNGASGTQRTSFASFVCFCEEKVGSGEGCFSQKATKATKSSTSLMAARERKDRKETPEICSDDGNPKHWLVLRNMRTHFADTICDHPTVARSGLPRSADFSPLPSGSAEIAGSGLKSALRPEISSQSAAQASSLYRKSAQRDCEGSIK